LGQRLRKTKEQLTKLPLLLAFRSPLLRPDTARALIALLSPAGVELVIY
jgi:hypothetical protein